MNAQRDRGPMTRREIFASEGIEMIPHRVGNDIFIPLRSLIGCKDDCPWEAIGQPHKHCRVCHAAHMNESGLCLPHEFASE